MTAQPLSIEIKLFFFSDHNKKLNFNHTTWNFTTSGHGKSVADGVGGSVKGLCNRAAAQERDIISAYDILLEVKNSPFSPCQHFSLTSTSYAFNSIKNSENRRKKAQKSYKN